LAHGLIELDAREFDQLSPLLGFVGHHATEFQCLPLGVKQTLNGHALMSAFDP